MDGSTIGEIQEETFSGAQVRMHIRGPSFYNLQSIGPMGSDSLVADAVAIVSSIDPILGEVDR